jgi:hypothetical protein
LVLFLCFLNPHPGRRLSGSKSRGPKP